MEESTDPGNLESGQEMGIVSRMIGALISPGRTFAAVNARVDHQDWYLPMIIIVVVGMISAYQLMPAAQTAGMEAIQEQLAQDESLTEEQRALALESAQKMMGLGAVVFGSLGSAVTIFIQALIFFVLANFVFGGDGTFKKTLAVVSYSSLVVIPAAIVTLLLAAAWDSASMQVGLGMLVPESMKGSFADHFLSMITVFAVWKYLLIAVGLGAVAGIRTKLAGMGVFGLWILYVLAAAFARSAVTV